MDKNASRLKSFPLCTYLWSCNKYWVEMLLRVCAVSPFAGVEWYCIMTWNRWIWEALWKSSIPCFVSTYDESKLRWKQRHEEVFVIGLSCFWVICDRAAVGTFVHVLLTGSLLSTRVYAGCSVYYFKKWLYLNPLWH